MQGEFFGGLAAEIKRLERYKKARASVESEKIKLEALRQHVPLTPQFDHLLGYEANLERNFDRTLNQLERLQRMRRDSGASGDQRRSARPVIGMAERGATRHVGMHSGTAFPWYH